MHRQVDSFCWTVVHGELSWQSPIPTWPLCRPVGGHLTSRPWWSESGRWPVVDLPCQRHLTAAARQLGRRYASMLARSQLVNGPPSRSIVGKVRCRLPSGAPAKKGRLTLTRTAPRVTCTHRPTQGNYLYLRHIGYGSIKYGYHRTPLNHNSQMNIFAYVKKSPSMYNTELRDGPVKLFTSWIMPSDITDTDNTILSGLVLLVVWTKFAISQDKTLFTPQSVGLI